MVVKNPWDDEDPWKNSHKIEDWKSKMFSFFGFKKGRDFFANKRQVLVLLVVLYSLTGFHQVQPDEKGVVLRFGKCVRKLEPGLSYVLPSPIERMILKKATRINQIDITSSESKEGLMLTGDLNLANVSFSVLWKIKEDDIESFIFNTRRPEKIIRGVAESVMRAIVGSNKFTYIQTEGCSEVQNKAREDMQALMDQYNAGVEIIRVSLRKVDPPASVIDSFRDVERAQAEQQSEKNKAEAYDRDTRARTRGEIAENLNKGEAQKQALIENARGNVARFLSAYSQYKLAPDVVAKRMYIDTMRDLYKNVKKVVVDSNVQSVPYLLPLAAAQSGDDKSKGAGV